MKAVMTFLTWIVLLNTAIATDGDNLSASGLMSADPQNIPALVDAMPPSKQGQAPPFIDDTRLTPANDAEPLQSGDISSGLDTLDLESLPRTTNSSPSVSIATQDAPHHMPSIDEYITLGQWALLNHAPGWGLQTPMEAEKFQLTNHYAYRLQDDIRSMVGEDIYAKMVWMYFDLKALDNQIYSTLEQYGWGRRGVLEQQIPIVTPNNPIQSIFTLAPPDPMQGYSLKTLSITDSESIENMWRDRQSMALADNSYRDSIVFKISEYLTFANLLYAMALWVSLNFLFKAFRFLVRSI